MARVTVEDCQHITSRFELVVIAAQRAKQIASGSELTVERDNDKDSVISLREIAAQTIDIEKLREDLVQGFRKRQFVDNFTKQRDRQSDEIEALMAEEGETIEDEDVEEHFSLDMDIAGSSEHLSFDSDNVDAED